MKLYKSTGAVRLITSTAYANVPAVLEVTLPEINVYKSFTGTVQVGLLSKLAAPSANTISISAEIVDKNTLGILDTSSAILTLPANVPKGVNTIATVSIPIQFKLPTNLKDFNINLGHICTLGSKVDIGSVSITGLLI